MPTLLTPSAIGELEELLWNSRREVSEIYREWKSGLTIQAMAEARNHSDLKKVKNLVHSLKILFGREMLPVRGRGRQQAIYEAAFFLNSDFYLSPELTEHLEKILLKAEKTNVRRNSNYEPPEIPKRSIYTQARSSAVEGDFSAVYVIGSEESELVKIGWSNNVWDRITNAQTWSPEPIKALRIFPCKNPNLYEAKLHIILDTLKLRVDHGGGKEWFVAPLTLIDEIAKALGLENFVEPN
jgi:hypothetical protein